MPLPKINPDISIVSLINLAVLVFGFGISWGIISNQQASLSTEITRNRSETTEEVARIKAESARDVARLEAEARSVEARFDQQAAARATLIEAVAERVRAAELAMASQTADLKNIQASLAEIKSALSRIDAGTVR